MGKTVQFRRGFFRRHRQRLLLVVILGSAVAAVAFSRFSPAKFVAQAPPLPNVLQSPNVLQPQGPSQKIAGQASVIDGDTIEIHGARIRLFGIDAPEGAQACTLQGRAWPCGRRAATALSDKIARRTVECRPKDRDQYDRVVAVCLVTGEDVNGWMVGQGWALAYRRFSQDYVDQERQAANAKRGMWQGEFEAPWDWRRHRIESPRSQAPPRPPTARFVTPP